MATADTVQLSEPHEPKEASINAFSSIEAELKQELIKLRRDHDKHESEYFALASSLSDSELTSFSFPKDLTVVRVGTSAYGLHLFGKVRIPALQEGGYVKSGGGYIHVRLFIGAEEGTDGSSEDERVAKLHSIHTEDVEKKDGSHDYRAIFGEGDELEWFDT